MCTYIFTFHREEYQFFIHSETPKWDGKNPPPNYGQDGNVSQFSEAMKRPKPRITTPSHHRKAMHHNLLDIGKNALHMTIFLLRGMCISPPFKLPINDSCCLKLREFIEIKAGYYFELHHFDNDFLGGVQPLSALQWEYSNRKK